MCVAAVCLESLDTNRHVAGLQAKTAPNGYRNGPS